MVHFCQIANVWPLLSDQSHKCFACFVRCTLACLRFVNPNFLDIEAWKKKCIKCLSFTTSPDFEHNDREKAFYRTKDCHINFLN